MRYRNIQYTTLAPGIGESEFESVLEMLEPQDEIVVNSEDYLIIAGPTGVHPLAGFAGGTEQRYYAVYEIEPVDSHSIRLVRRFVAPVQQHTVETATNWLENWEAP